MSDQDNEIWKAGFDLHNKYGDGPKTDADWIHLADDCNDLYRRFDMSDFSFRMAMMIMGYYNEKRREKTPTDPEQIAMRM